MHDDDNDAALAAQQELEEQERTMSLHTKLAEIQKTLNAPKGQYNKFGGYNYRSCEDILTAVKPLLGDLTIIISDEIVMLGDRFYVKATAAITDGQSRIESTSYAREAATKKGMDEAQITGSTSSYARKYALNGLLLIDDAKDADATNDHGKSEAKTKATRHEKAFQDEPLEADAMVVAQLNAAQTVPDLVKTMNGLAPEQKRMVTQHFNQRMNELKRAA